LKAEGPIDKSPSAAHTRGGAHACYRDTASNTGTHFVLPPSEPSCSTRCTDYSPVTAVVSVDYTAPETIMHCPPPLVNETSFTIYGVVEDDSIKTSGSEFKLGDAPYMPTTAVAADGSFSLVLTDLTEGPYSLKVRHANLSLGH
jgi:hypothetical protein